MSEYRILSMGLEGRLDLTDILDQRNGDYCIA